MEVVPELLHSYVIICLASGQSTSSLFIFIDIRETIYVCAALMLQCIIEMAFLFCERLSGVALKEMCHCSLDNKVALCTKTNPPRPFLSPRGHLYSVQNWGKQGEGEALTKRGRGRLRERERERPMFFCVCILCLNVMLQRCSHSKRSGCDLA